MVTMRDKARAVQHDRRWTARQLVVLAGYVIISSVVLRVLLVTFIPGSPDARVVVLDPLLFLWVIALYVSLLPGALVSLYVVHRGLRNHSLSMAQRSSATALITGGLATAIASSLALLNGVSSASDSGAYVWFAANAIVPSVFWGLSMNR